MSLEESNALIYKTEFGWTFPFTQIDPSYGRIAWCVEPIYETLEDGATLITSIIVSAKQTRDECYAGKLFRLPANTPGLMTYDATGGGPKNFFASVYILEKCSEHGAILLFSHPSNGRSRLCFDDLHSSIASLVWYE